MVWSSKSVRLFLLLLRRLKCLKQEHNKYWMTNIRQWSTSSAPTLILSMSNYFFCYAWNMLDLARQIHCQLIATSFRRFFFKTLKSSNFNYNIFWCTAYINYCCWLRVSKPVEALLQLFRSGKVKFHFILITFNSLKLLHFFTLKDKINELFDMSIPVL